MHVKTSGQEDAVPDIDRSMGEGGNEELVPAWAGGQQGSGARDQAMGFKGRQGERRGGEVSERRSECLSVHWVHWWSRQSGVQGTQGH